MKEKVDVAAVQMDVKGLDPEANLAHMLELIDSAVSGGHVDLVVFPELANSGYVKGGDLEFHKSFVRIADQVPGVFTDTLGEAAKKNGIYIAAGMLRNHPDIPYMFYNSSVLIGPDGKVITIHDKMHLHNEERHFFYPGNTMNVVKTDLGNIAVQVCADASFPEVCRTFALKGAEIVCTCYAGPLTEGHEYLTNRLHHQVPSRAQENLLFFIGCNRVGSDLSGSFYGRSCIAGPLGQILASSTTAEEEILRATLHKEMLLECRIMSPYFRDRIPELYSLITQRF